MDNITNSTNDNLGGLATIKFAPVGFFVGLNPAVFKTGLDWIELICTSETMLFTEETVNDDNCGFLNLTINGIAPKIRSDISAIIRAYRLQKCIVQCEDNNGTLRQAGTLDNGLLFSDKSTTGTVAADANGYTFSFSGQQLDTALFL